MHQRIQYICLLLITLILINVVPVYAVDQPQTLGKAALLMDASSGRVLYSVNGHKRLPPASITKIMTGLLVVEKGNLNKEVSISEKAAETPESSIWLEAGEKLTRQELLYACMLNSANDAAVALTESVAGSEDSFVKLMNQRAWQLGMKDTHFCNPHGLHTKEHYTSAYDMALLSREALTHSAFRQVVGTRVISIPWAGNLYNRQLINQNRLLYRYDGAIGVKTGYTRQAGNCVVGAAQRGDLILIAVAMNSPSVYQDLIQMLDYGFSQYKKVTIKQAHQLSLPVQVSRGQSKTVNIRPEGDLSVAVTEEEQSKISYRLHRQNRITAPVREGQTLGRCTMYIDGQEAGEINLIATSSVTEKLPLLMRLKAACPPMLKVILKTLLILFLIVYLLRLRKLRLRRNRNLTLGPGPRVK